VQVQAVFSYPTPPVPLSDLSVLPFLLGQTTPLNSSLVLRYFIFSIHRLFLDIQKEKVLAFSPFF